MPMVFDSAGWGFWPSVENYIVDASILEAAFGLFHKDFDDMVLRGCV